MSVLLTRDVYFQIFLSPSLQGGLGFRVHIFQVYRTFSTRDTCLKGMLLDLHVSVLAGLKYNIFISFLPFR